MDVNPSVWPFKLKSTRQTQNGRRREEEGMEGLEEGNWSPHFFSIIDGAVKS